MPERENETAPIRQSVVVDCPIDETFALFTGRLAEWWPLASHSICGEDADTCAMEPWVGGRVYERSPVRRGARMGNRDSMESSPRRHIHVAP